MQLVDWLKIELLSGIQSLDAELPSTPDLTHLHEFDPAAGPEDRAWR
jgi:hypothetical protein